MKKATLIFAGDFCSCAPENIIISEELKIILNKSDINILNIEGVFKSDDVCTANQTFLTQSEYVPQWCKDNNFKLVSMANNHSFDYGETGLKKTISAMDGCDIISVGVGNWTEAYSVKFLTINGLRIGFYAATSADLASLKDKEFYNNQIGCAWINHPETRKNIHKAKKECDYLFIMPHAGVEYMNIPLPEWRSIYKELIDLGADAVLASHPHVPQGIEEYKGKPIYYSLGNFFFEGSGDITKSKHKYWNTGLIAMITISDNGLTYKTYITKRSFYNLGIENDSSIIEHCNNITQILNDDKEYWNLLEKNILHFHYKYKTWLLSGLNAQEMKFSTKKIISILKSIFFRKPNYRLALHQIREESSLWTLQRALKILSKTKL